MYNVIKQTARNLRKTQTESEEIFWQEVRNRKILGRKFFRQHPIQFEYMGRTRYFIADFYCPEKKLVVEIDGKIHENQKEYDDLRTWIINQLGIKVIRFTNDELNDMPKVKALLNNHLT